MIDDASFHSGRDAQGLVDARDAVPQGVERDGGLVVLELRFARGECIEGDVLGSNGRRPRSQQQISRPTYSRHALGHVLE